MQRTNPRCKYKAGKIYTNPIFALVVVVLVIAVLLLISKSAGDAPNSDFYAQGVYINNVDMSRYTRQEGEKQVQQWASSILGKEYTFTFSNPDDGQIYSWDFTPSMVDARMNVDDVLARSWSLGHSGSRSDQAKTQQDLRNQPVYFTIALSYDQEKFDAYVDSIYYDSKIYIQPVDAQIVLTATKPEVYAPSSDGRELNREKFTQMLLSPMNNGSNTTVFELPVEITMPAVSSDLAENGLQLIAEYSTDLSESSSDRCSNVQLALSKFNGYEVKPGESVSFNAVVGPRTILQGFKEATVYYGDTVTNGVGGGVCQASSTLYGAILMAGMDVTERDHHSLIVGYCQSSMDAAVSDKQDFVFMNHTDYTIYIYTNVINKVKATVYVYGNRPDYRIELVSTITQNNIKNPASDIREDKTGEVAYYDTDIVLVKEGKLGRKSKLERLYYDWNTNALVDKELISEDYYAGERDIYYQGIHKNV